MRLPNLLASRRGRLLAFFLLYTTEGVPLGFAATAVASQLRRMGVGPAEIGAFVAAFYLPWAFKWAYGPMVDVFRSARWGHRRAWILGTQAVMAATILALLAVPLPQGLALFTAILLVHNSFAAMQDVAIDALAVGTLADDERGLANGLMFAGASLGQALGGAGVLFLAGPLGFDAGYLLVAGAILSVTAFVVVPMREAESPAALAAGGGWRAAGAEMQRFAERAFAAFLGSRAAFAGLFFALLPAGAMSLSLALQSSLAVELGMTNDGVAALSLATTLSSAVAMVVGGLIGDRLGRRRSLALYVLLMSLPVLYMAWVLHQAGYQMPRAPGGVPLPELITHLRIATVAFAVAMGLMYGVRSAVFMDITDTRVAATQFTAYMAMMNLAIAMAATWQGAAVEALGYPATLLIDALLGPLCLLFLPAMKAAAGAVSSVVRVEARARWSARVLALGCLGFVAWWLQHDAGGRFANLLNTLFTIVFVATALFLLAASLMQAMGPLARAGCRGLALAVLLLYGRRFIGADGDSVLRALAQALVVATPAAAAAAMVAISLRPWPGLQALLASRGPAPAEASGPVPAADRGSGAG